MPPDIIKKYLKNYGNSHKSLKLSSLSKNLGGNSIRNLEKMIERREINAMIDGDVIVFRGIINELKDYIKNNADIKLDPKIIRKIFPMLSEEFIESFLNKLRV